ncbi:FecR domain-containing protein [Arenibacter sp. F26102]|uniref:FecR family protein n=1 Tax=Arenibacter sp. F26102 TaxID=2926416 RepID=UPI001FF15860|nr:FecR family protein [Arenibacter sp. F26102]MCK0147143.1 FecR domain-containing protein [Arenibacter sp. F26102]
MPVFHKLIHLSKQIASSLLKDKQPVRLEQSELFSDEDKAYIIKSLTEDASIKERLDLINKIDTKTDWETVKNKIVLPAKKRNWTYPAAAVLVVAVMSVYFIKFNLSTASSVKSPVISGAIEVGTNKAILTLEDGSNVTLEKGDSFNTKTVYSNGEQIVYNAKESKKSEVAYNYLTVPRGGQFSLKLSDGTKVWLNSESQLKYPITFKDGEDRKVELIYGEAYFDVTSSEDYQGAGFVVSNSRQNIKVLGTEFNVKAYKDEANIYTTLVEGKVAVSIDGVTENLLPDQQSILDTNTKSFTVGSVDVNIEISWKDGVFSFDGLTLKEIMKVLSRWYDIEVVFLNKATENEEFIGILSKDQKIEDILYTIKNFKIIKDYEIIDNTVILK